MYSRKATIVAAILLLFLTVACTNKKVNNPLADVGSKQPDKVLFDRAMEQMKHNRFDQARMILQTLINTYPDSEYIARAKLAVGDSWYAEGGTTSLTQAELEYKDFITFFPNMPEAAEAQLKIANIHYQQMEKPDRDFTHAMRAEEEYRQLLLQFPDSKLAPEAKQRLMEVQEVLAQREYQIGRFYYMRNSFPAAIARLQSIVDRYPLYSGADEALYLLGQSYEGEINVIRASKMQEAAKARLIQEFTKNASTAYSRIITRYPLMDRSEDAKRRLVALKQPVPTPTKAAVAQNQREEESRRSSGLFGKMMGNFSRHPDVAQATKVGEPTLVDPKPVSATEVVAAANRAAFSTGKAGDNKVSVERVKEGAPPPNEAAPRSDTPPAAPAEESGNNKAVDSTATTSVEQITPGDGSLTATPPAATPPAAPAPSTDSAGTSGIGELKPNVDSGADTGSQQPAPPPSQVNEIQKSSPADADSGSATGSSASSSSSSADNSPADPNYMSSSKKKKKKHKLFF